MAAIPDEVLAYVGVLWKELGYNPVFVYRLIEHGYLHCEVDYAMKKIIGEDWADVNASTWIDRLCAKDNEMMIHSLEYDVPPVIDILVHEIGQLLIHDKPKALCPYCEVEKAEREKH